MPLVSSHVTGGGSGVQTDGDHAGRSDQAEPRRVSLPGSAVRGAPADVSQRGGRCAGVTVVHVWARHRVAGGTAAPEGTPDGRCDSSGGAQAPGTAGREDRAAGNSVPVRGVLHAHASEQ